MPDPSIGKDMPRCLWWQNVVGSWSRWGPWECRCTSPESLQRSNFEKADVEVSYPWFATPLWLIKPLSHPLTPWKLALLTCFLYCFAATWTQMSSVVSRLFTLIKTAFNVSNGFILAHLPLRFTKDKCYMTLSQHKKRTMLDVVTCSVIKPLQAVTEVSY